MTTSVKNNFLPPSLISNLQQVFLSTNTDTVPPTSTDANNPLASHHNVDYNHLQKDKPLVLITNGEGMESPGLTSLVEALVSDGRFGVYVCAPQLDRSVSSHSLTVTETVAASSVELHGATGFEVSGTPADCVSLALSGALFSWSKPDLVISGINRGSSCGHNMFYSGTVAAAREALICGVPAVSISLNWKKGVNSENDFKDAASVSLPLLYAVVRDLKMGILHSNCLLHLEVPTCPLTHKGFKVTKQSPWRSSLSWQAVSANRYASAGNFMSNQQSLGIKLAQLSRDASAAGAARKLNSHRKNVEIESVGVAGKVSTRNAVKKYFRLEFLEKEHENVEEDLDYRALEDGFVAVTPFSLTAQSEVQAVVSNWMSTALSK